MYSEANDSSLADVATKQQQPREDTEASSTRDITTDVDSSHKETETQQETSQPTERCELERLRLAFSELRDEVDALKKEMEDDIPVLRRGVGIRILKDKIQSFIEEGEIGSLKSRIVKVQDALDMERQRCFDLEQQLKNQLKEEDELKETRAHLVYCEKQAEEWKTKHDELERTLQETTSQLDSRTAEQQSLALSLSKANATIRQLQCEKEEMGREAVGKMTALAADLEAECRAKETACERIQHLEKLVLKLTEESNTTSESNGVSDGTSIEPAPPSETSNSKMTTSFPDPPSEEVSSKGDERGDTEQEKQAIAVEAEVNENLTELEEPIASETTVKKQEVLLSQTPSMSHQDRSWKWNVSGLWGFVTGEPTQ